MTGFVNRRIVKPNIEQAGRMCIDSTPKVFEGPRAEAYADAFQDYLAAHGVASQQVHERHVLVREDVRWKTGLDPQDRIVTPQPIILADFLRIAAHGEPH